MVYAGSALMAFNIFLYVRFASFIRKSDSLDRESRVLNIPIFLLVLFLAGYLAVAIFGKPDVIMSGILFGGSIFVFVMLWLIERTVARIKAGEQLQAKLAAAEEANKAKTFFLSNMSHDLRTPLNAIIGYTALAKNEQSPEKQLEFIGKIDSAGHQLLGIVNNVLEMSRIESGRLEVVPVRMNLEACITEAGELLKGQMKEKRIEFASFCEIEHKWVRGDKNLINRVLINLLGNAVKFTGEGGKITLAVAELNENSGVAEYELTVADTGIGMSREFVDKLFSPFERERTSTVSKTQGTGLGMAITKNIVELMEGKIEVITKEGEGTKFVITLSFPTESEAAGEESAEEVRFDGLRVLLVEDNEVNMEIAEMLLAQLGFCVETADNGQAAVEKVICSEAGYFDLVITDIQMPVMDGYEEARTIRALADPALSRIPIIAMTANAFKEDISATVKAGMNAHVAKPIDIANMTETIKKVLSEE